MQKENLIPADEFCSSHHIEVSFIRSLQESGLIEMVVTKDAKYIHTGQLQQLERIVRLYYEMDINLEGIETITHLLQRINSQQHEITTLKNRLRLYEMNE
jgi:MerR HTH family regulatory protein